MKLVEELGVPELASEHIEALCLIAEKAARRHVLTSFSSKMVESLSISVEAEGTKPLSLTVEIDLMLSPCNKEVDLKKIVRDATREAFRASDNYLRKLP